MGEAEKSVWIMGSLWKIKDTVKLMDDMHKVVNLMKDLKKLVADHLIQNELYYGDGLKRVFKLLGDRRLETWIKETCEKKLSKEENWFFSIRRSLLEMMILLEDLKAVKITNFFINMMNPRSVTRLPT